MAFWSQVERSRELAVAIVDLLLAHGADATFKRGDGLTAADVARDRYLTEAAKRLDQAGSRTSNTAPPPS